MQRNSQWQPRNRVPVTIRTVDAEVLEGFVFVPSDMRVSDILDGSRRFLPFLDTVGEFSLIAKSAIRRLIPDDAQSRARRRAVKAARAGRRGVGKPEPTIA